MRKLEVSSLISKIEAMCIDANYNVSPTLMDTLKQAQNSETSVLGKNILSQIIIKMMKLLRQSQVPMCQDTGITVVFC